MDKQCSHEEEEEEMDEDSENSQLLRLMARHTQLRDLLHAHHLVGTHYKLFYAYYIYVSHILCQYVLILPLHPLLLSLGGYDITKTRQGKGVCVSLATAYEGVYLETYNLEIDLKPKLRISRHNVPPFIPLSSLAEQSNMQTHMRTFLDTLSQHLNGFVGRKQQLNLVKVPDFAFVCVCWVGFGQQHFV